MTNHLRTLLVLGLSACHGVDDTTALDRTESDVTPDHALPSQTAHELSTSLLRPVSGLSTLPADCGVPNPSATLYRNTEVQPVVVADPGNPLHLVANFQQDRWSKFGGNAVVTYVSNDGGLDWHPARAQPKFTRCAGGTAANGDPPHHDHRRRQHDPHLDRSGDTDGRRPRSRAASGSGRPCARP